MRRRAGAPPPSLSAAPAASESWPKSAELASLVFLCLFLLLAPLGPSLQGYTEASDLLPGLLLGALALVPLVALVLRARVGPAGGPAVLLAVLLLVWAGLSQVWSFSPHDSRLEWSHWAAGVAAYLAARWHARSPRSAKALFASLVVGATLTALLGLRNYAETYRTDPTWRIFATFQNPNFLASYLVISAPLTLAGALASRRPWVLPLSAATLFQFGALMLTGSRGGWLSMVVALVVLLAAGWRHLGQGRGLRLAALMAILIAVAPVLAFPTARRVASSGVGEQASSMAFRKLTWAGTGDLAAAHPVLGTGLGTFEVAYPPYARAGFTRLAHNSYLQLAAELGVPGLALFLGLVLTSLLAGGRGERWRGSGWTRAGLWAASAGFLVHNGLDSMLYVPSTAWTFFALLGALAANGGSTTPRSAYRRLWVAAAILGVLGALWGLPSGVGAPDAARAEELRGRGDAVGALDAIQDALHWDAGNPEWRLLEAELVMALGEPERGLRLYERLAADEPHRGQVFYRWARTLLALGRPQEALPRVQRAVALEPNRTEPLLLLARVEEALGNPAAAEQAYRRLVRLEQSPVGRVRALAGFVDLSYAEAYLALAKREAALGDAAEARRMAKGAARVAGEFVREIPTWKPKLEIVGQWNPEREIRARQILSEARDLAGPRPRVRGSPGSTGARHPRGRQEGQPLAAADSGQDGAPATAVRFWPAGRGCWSG